MSNITEQLIREMGERVLYFLGDGWIYVENSGMNRRLQYHKNERVQAIVNFSVDELADREALANALAANIASVLKLYDGIE